MSATAFCALIISIGRATPILPQAVVTQEMRSLAGIHDLKFIIEPLPLDIEQAVGRRAVRRHCTPRLSDRGFGLSDDEKAAIVLRLSINYREDEAVRNGAALVCFLTLEQPVRIERLDTTLVIPTWTGASIDIVAKDRLHPTLMRGLDEVFDDFFLKSALASRIP